METCTGCELAATCRTSNMPPDLSEMHNGSCDVMIIGEAPGAEEDQIGKPFVGASGSLLRMVIEDVGLDEFGLVYTNVVRCRPPNNATPSAKQIKVCAPKTIAEIEKYNPSMIILLGNVPLKAVLGESGITNWRGAKLERGGRVYVPTFHPSYILRNNTELPSMVADLQKAYDVVAEVGNQSLVDDYEIQLVVGAQDADLMYDAIKAAGLVSWDTESRNKYPYARDARMIMLSFAVNKPTKRAWAVLPGNAHVDAVCRRLLQDVDLKIICHNAKYDQHVVWNEWRIEVPGVVGDSMLASWMLDTMPGRHGLKELAGRFLGMYEYNSQLDDYHARHPESNPASKRKAGYGNQELVPVDILAPYAAMDAIATLELHRKLYKQMDKVQRVLYNELIIPTSYALFDMERDGVAMDPYIAERYSKVYAAIQRRQEAAMLEDPTVQRFIKARQAAMTKAYNEKYAGKTTRVQPPVFVFNSNSDLQMRELLFGKRYFGLEVLGRTDKNEPSTKWEWLRPFLDEIPFLQSYHYYSILGKMLSTYVGPATKSWVDKSHDGRVRSTYNIHGTVSGRLSSSNPNLQNIPTPEKEPDTVLAVLPVKNIFTASNWAQDYPEEWQSWLASSTPEELAYWQERLGPYFDKGGVVLAADYSGMELRTMASVAGCEGMMEIFARGDDVHRIVSAGIFGVPVEEVTKEMRYKGKWTNWTLLYGGSEYTFQRLYGIPLAEGKRFVNVYYGLFPEIREYQEDTKAFAREHGYVESPLGQRRYLPYINEKKDGGKRSHAEREAVNHPIQSVASQMLLMALVILNAKVGGSGLRTKLVNTVHDQVMMDTPLWELRQAAKLIKHSMEDLLDIYKNWFPNLDLSWFICPLKADIEIGSHYGSISEYHMEES